MSSSKEYIIIWVGYRGHPPEGRRGEGWSEAAAASHGRWSDRTRRSDPFA